MWNYDVPNGQVTGDMAYKYAHRNDSYEQQYVPFNMARYEEEKFNKDYENFKKLYIKYKDEIKDVLEFAKLWKRFTPNASKYME